MKYVVTTAQMRAAEEYAIKHIGLPDLVLMERAALSVADRIGSRFESLKDLRVCIICGTGNNGGDGFALGRILSGRGASVFLFAVGDESRASKANRLQRQMLRKLKIEVSTGQPMGEYDVIVDALFGTGLKRDIEGEYAAIVHRVNAMKGWKVSVDIPSGVHTDTGEILGCAFKADLTVTFGFEKWGLLLYPGKTYCGMLSCEDIGIPKDADFGETIPGIRLAEEDKNNLPKRFPDSNKGTYGRAGVIAGSKDMGGAAMLSSSAALRMGTGYVKVMTHEVNRNLILETTPEALLYTYGEDGTYPLEKVTDCQALLLGPGVGVTKETERLLELVFEKYSGILILDADALNLIAGYSGLKDRLKSYAVKMKKVGCSVILTPHKKEFCKLAGLSLEAGEEEMSQKAEELSKEYGVILVLKDAATRVFTPDGRVYVNTSGNSGMSTAGSGDVLAGILCGLFTLVGARGVDRKDWAREDGIYAALGVYLHGLCGDVAAQEKNPYAMTPSDMIDALSLVLKDC